jgi:pyrroline-5-carboxylate reductase
VASPGGSTGAGLEVLDAAGVEQTFADAAKASIDRMRP